MYLCLYSCVYMYILANSDSRTFEGGEMLHTCKVVGNPVSCYFAFSIQSVVVRIALNSTYLPSPQFNGSHNISTI